MMSSDYLRLYWWC